MFARPGGGLAHFIDAVKEMASSDYGGDRAACASVSEPAVALPLVAGQVSLPSLAAAVDLTSPEVLPERLIGYLQHERRLLRSEKELNGPCPPMHMDVQNWQQLASELWETGMVRWVPASWVPRVRGRVKKAGLFGVPKSKGELLRLI
eukprot:956884-Amphidinium_carterae.1